MENSIKPKLGDLVQVTFYDHCHITESEKCSVLKAIVWGRLHSADAVEYKVLSWQSLDSDYKQDYYCIVNGAVIDIKVLEIR